MDLRADAGGEMACKQQTRGRVFKEAEESLVGSGISDCSGGYELQQNRGATDEERASLSATSNRHLMEMDNGRLWKDEREERHAPDRLR